MPSRKRYAGTVNVHIPHSVRNGIDLLISKDGTTQAEIVRRLLEEGLKAIEAH